LQHTLWLWSFFELKFFVENKYVHFSTLLKSPTLKQNFYVRDINFPRFYLFVEEK